MILKCEFNGIELLTNKGNDRKRLNVSFRCFIFIV